MNTPKELKHRSSVMKLVLFIFLIAHVVLIVLNPDQTVIASGSAANSEASIGFYGELPEENQGPEPAPKPEESVKPQLPSGRLPQTNEVARYSVVLVGLFLILLVIVIAIKRSQTHQKHS